MKLLVVAVGLCGCALGPPPGFSQGNTWTLPLVDPLSEGRLVTTLTIEGKGPYLVALDPDAPVTVLESQLIADGHFPAHSGPREIDESDTSHPMFSAVVTNLRLGDLTISQRTVLVALPGAFAGEGRAVQGVIGRDIIADSLVFGFDRDRGIAWLQTQDTYKAPSDATVLDYFRGTRERGDLVTRRLVTANVDGKPYDVHLDLGATHSQLRAMHWQDAKLEQVPANLTVVDEFGGRRDVHVAGVAQHVTAGKIAHDRLAFLPYDDRRWDFGQLEGTLALDFFRPYSVAADWHHERYLLSERHASPEQRAERFSRWGDTFPAMCRASGCASVKVDLVEGQTVAHVAKDPAATGKPMELVVASAALPHLYFRLPADKDAMDVVVDARYASQPVELVDLEPMF
jgi:hypothetical protein